LLDSSSGSCTTRGEEERPRRRPLLPPTACRPRPRAGGRARRRWRGWRPWRGCACRPRMPWRGLEDSRKRELVSGFKREGKKKGKKKTKQKRTW
jgi:hypothetical protein